MKLPQWTKNFFPHKLQPLTESSYVYNAYNDELKRLKGGVFVNKTFSDWDDKVAEKLKTKIMLFAGHDSTVTNILSAFNVWDSQFPDYGITALLEFSLNRKTGEYGVELLLRNSSRSEPFSLTIPGCTKFCPLKDVKTLLKNTVSVDHEKECKPMTEGYTEKPLGGP